MEELNPNRPLDKKMFQDFLFKVSFRYIDISAFNKDYSAMHPEDFVREFDLMHKQLKSLSINLRKDKKVSIDEYRRIWEQEIIKEFGAWSHEANKELRKLSKLEGLSKELKQKYSWAYAYWWNLYHKFEYDYKVSKLVADTTYKKVNEDIDKSRKTIKKLVFGEILLEVVHQKFLENIGNLAKTDMPEFESPYESIEKGE